MNPRLTKMSLPNRGGISSEVFNLFCNQSLINLHYLYARLWKQDQEIKTNLKMAITETEEKIKKYLKEDAFFYENLNRIYNREYILEQKANELLRSIQ
jgi:hypothetical protein